MQKRFSLSKVYKLREMARPVGSTKDAATRQKDAVLAWCSNQPGSFTFDQMYKFSLENGWEQTYQSFHAIMMKFVAKGSAVGALNKYADRVVSAKHPLEVVQSGRQGGPKGKWILKWGTGLPKKPMPDKHEKNIGDTAGAMDRLETAIGREPARACLMRWKRMSTIDQIRHDIDVNISGGHKLKMDAMHIAVELLHGKHVGPARSQDSEEDYNSGFAPDEDDYGNPEEFQKPWDQENSPVGEEPESEYEVGDDMELGASGASSFKSKKDDVELGSSGKSLFHKDEPEVASAEDQDDYGEEPEMSEPEETHSEEPGEISDSETSADEDDYGEDEEPASQEEPEVAADEEEPETEDSDDDGGDWPIWLPEITDEDPDEDPDGHNIDPDERAMYKLVHEAGIKKNDPLWGQLKNAKSQLHVRSILAKSPLPKKYEKFAMIVAKSIFHNTKRDKDWDSGKMESKLLSLYRL